MIHRIEFETVTYTGKSRGPMGGYTYTKRAVGQGWITTGMIRKYGTIEAAIDSIAPRLNLKPVQRLDFRMLDVDPMTGRFEWALSGSTRYESGDLDRIFARQEATT